MRQLTRVLLLASALSGCSGYKAPTCSISDLDDAAVSTRSVFLERLSGCPIGGR